MPIPALAELTRISQVRLPQEPPCPEIPAGHRPLFVLDASTGLEDRLLRGWLRRCDPGFAANVHQVAPSRIRRRGRRTDPALETKVFHAEHPTWVIPLRVAWMPAERDGHRSVSWLDVLKLGDPRDPRWWRDYIILGRSPDRVRIVVGEGASDAELVAAQQVQTDEANPIDSFTRRAWRVLDRAERAERGNRYKISRFVAEDIINRPSFRQEAILLGRRRGLPEVISLARARYYLREMAATHSPFLIDLIANLINWIIRQGYGAIYYNSNSLDEVARLGRDYPLVFLPTHKSNLDRLSLQFMLWENDLPPNHTAGGINMNFFPVGPLVRRTGVFFIRRSFKDNDLYKFVVRTYLDYLIERRFPLEWYMEGGRSRSGKLRPPRYGMLSWVVDGFARGKAEDIYLLPISIAYDQIQEVGAYVNEATGGSKEKESFGWAVKFARSLRRRYGDIHIRFAEPISMAKELEGADLADQNPIEVQKLAFEVMYRMSAVTPITPTALVATILLAAKGQARDIYAISEAARAIVDYIETRELPTTVPLPTTPESLRSTLALMADHGLISTLNAGGRTVHWMDGDQKLRAAYYAGTVEHFFVPRGLAEVALVTATDIDTFWGDVFALRDLLKFEFFFAEREEFRQLVADDLAIDAPDWEEAVARGEGSRIGLQPSTVGWSVAPLLESYLIVADELASRRAEIDKDEFLDACLDRGRLYLLEGKIEADESVSRVLFEGGLRLAENRRLVTVSPDTPERRAAFAIEMDGYVAAARKRSEIRSR
ncbi:MAG TPA: 1-acyl-sn-glycerol-3-phosphate acyltransferase [Acidimicrobiia bacterium]|nr:1-acyl-sn-glycerol-3-phosphate acyltransferase [Acidimicrobiia bacterium]